MIQETVKKSIIKEVKRKNSKDANFYRFLSGEIERAATNKEKTVTDETAINILDALKKKMIRNFEYFKNDPEKTSRLENEIQLIEQFLPQKIEAEEIKSWIKDNIDFSKLKNKMQATGIVMKHFSGQVDGKVVSEIIKNW
jgi:uncharacterized protein YqeY